MVLQPHLTSNPIVCLACRGEIEPSELGFGEDLAERLFQWQAFHDCFYLLWLDSGEFESWAEAQLRDPSSPVNTRGLAARAELDAYRRAYYWWFGSESAPDDDPVAACPSCGGQLASRWGHRVCEPCSILVP